MQRWWAARGKRPWSYFLHSVLGLQVSLLMGFVCLTGSLAAVSYEIEWLLLPKVRANVPDKGNEWTSLGQQWQAARQARPEISFNSISLGGHGHGYGAESYLASVVSGKRADGSAITVHVDPATARVQGETSGVTFHALMRGLHYYLLAPTNIPFYVVTSLGFVLIASLVTGLLVYKKFWCGFFRWPRFAKANTRVGWGDLHRLSGLWSIWFVLLIGLTSVWYLAERAEWLSWEPKLEAKTTPAAMKNDQPSGNDIDRWVGLAQDQVNGLRPTSVFLSSATSVVTVQGQASAWLVRQRANAVRIDRANDRVIQVRRADQMRLSERWVHTADPLHFGDFAGLASKLVWFLFGIILTSLSITGAVIYLKRTRAAIRGMAATSDTGNVGVAMPLQRYLKALNFLKWPSIVLVTLVPALGYLLSWRHVL